MAKTSMLARENKRLKSAAKYLKRRDAIKETMKCAFKSEDFQVILEAQAKLQKLPRDSSKIRSINRCNQCGRPHAVYQKFKLCRICLRNQLMQGNVPGGRKASW